MVRAQLDGAGTGESARPVGCPVPNCAAPDDSAESIVSALPISSWPMCIYECRFVHVVTEHARTRWVDVH